MLRLLMYQHICVWISLDVGRLLLPMELTLTLPRALCYSEVPVVPAQALQCEPQAWAVPLPCPEQDPLAHGARHGAPQDQAGRPGPGQAQDVRGRASPVRPQEAHGCALCPPGPPAQPQAKGAQPSYALRPVGLEPPRQPKPASTIGDMHYQKHCRDRPSMISQTLAVVDVLSTMNSAFVCGHKRSITVSSLSKWSFANENGKPKPSVSWRCSFYCILVSSRRWRWLSAVS